MTSDHLPCITHLDRERQNGFSDIHRGRLMVLTGMKFTGLRFEGSNLVIEPKLCTGHELADNASKVVEMKMKFETMSQYVWLRFPTCKSLTDSLLY